MKAQQPTRRGDDFSPSLWSEYFDVKDDISVDSGTFRLYRRGYEGALLFFLHGGGFSGLSWSVLSQLITQDLNCQCIALDLRGHGDTVCENEVDMSLQALTDDVFQVIISLFPTEAPPIILVGHSMGGAVAIQLAASRKVPSLSALVVIDVVEGTALESLNGMRALLGRRPKGFRSLSEAIRWSVQSRQITNLRSAKVSFPGHLKRAATGQTAVTELERRVALVQSGDAEQQQQQEEEYLWRIDLKQSEAFWRGWFAGMSERFLSVPEPKLLIVAGTDRLDKALMIAQMQGKFQYNVIPKSGHAVHEDQPDAVADILRQFLQRYRFATPRKKLLQPSAAS